MYIVKKPFEWYDYCYIGLKSTIKNMKFLNSDFNSFQAYLTKIKSGLIPPPPKKISSPKFDQPANNKRIHFMRVY